MSPQKSILEMQGKSRSESIVVDLEKMIGFRLSLYLGVLLNELFITKFKLLSRSFDVDNKDKFTVKIKEITDILDKNKLILNYEKHSTAGSKLFEVILRNESKFTKWREEHGL